jgi:hypothetical protein
MMVVDVSHPDGALQYRRAQRKAQRIEDIMARAGLEVK